MRAWRSRAALAADAGRRPTRARDRGTARARCWRAALRLAHEHGDAQRRDRARHAVRVEPARLRGDLERDRRAGDAHDLEQRRASGRSSATRAESASSSVSAARASHRRASRWRRISCEEHRVAAGLARHALEIEALGGAGHEALGERAALLVASAARARALDGRAPRARSSSARDRSTAHGREHEDRRRVGAAQQLAQQQEAVGVGPLQVVDRDARRAACARARRAARAAPRTCGGAARAARRPRRRAPAAAAIASIRWNTGNSRTSSVGRARAAAARPRRLAARRGAARARRRRRRTPCTARTRARSSGREDTSAPDRSSASSRANRATSSDLPMPDSPTTRCMRGWVRASRRRRVERGALASRGRRTRGGRRPASTCGAAAPRSMPSRRRDRRTPSAARRLDREQLRAQLRRGRAARRARARAAAAARPAASATMICERVALCAATRRSAPRRASRRPQYQSAASPTCRPIACSGAMYSTVPIGRRRDRLLRRIERA